MWVLWLYLNHTHFLVNKFEMWFYAQSLKNYLFEKGDNSSYYSYIDITATLEINLNNYFIHQIWKGLDSRHSPYKSSPNLEIKSYFFYITYGVVF